MADHHQSSDTKATTRATFRNRWQVSSQALARLTAINGVDLAASRSGEVRGMYIGSMWWFKRV